MGKPARSSPVLRAAVTGMACLACATTCRDAPIAAAQRSSSTFAVCEPQAGQAWAYDNLMCLRRVAGQRNLRDEARRRLRDLGAGNDGRPWATLVLAHLTLDDLHRAQAIALYESAAADFAGRRDAEGETIARQNLANQYRLLGRVELAAEQVARAVSAAEASQQPWAVARAAVIEATHAMATGGDIGRAHRVLVRADRVAASTAPIGLRRTILFNLANAGIYLGHPEAALDALERHRALRAEDGSLQEAAAVEFNRLVAHTLIGGRRQRPDTREQLVAEAEAVVAEARGLKDPLVEAQAHKVLGDLLGTSDPEGARVHLRRCLDIEATLGFPIVRTACLWSLAQQESTQNPRRAEELSEEALRLVGSANSELLLAFAWQARLRLVWRTLAPDQAITQSLEAIEAIERLRSTQRGEVGRAALHGNWVRDYQWLTGQLLQGPTPDLARAFEVGERLRARVLLEHLAPMDTPRTSDSDGDFTSGQLTQRIAKTQRRLLAGFPMAPQRQALLDQLRLLELEQEDVRDGRIPALGANAVPFASLSQIQRALGAHEAMIWFSVAPWKDFYGQFGGGLWAVAITRHRAFVYPLSAGDDLDSQVSAFTGLLRDRSAGRDAWTPAGRRLGRTLLGDALRQLPPDITTLVIVSDGALHRLPFEALSPDNGPMLGERLDITVTPSATLWLRLRQSTTARSGGVLVLADPDVAGSPDGETRLSALPGARLEAQAIARILDLEPAYVAEGAAASERLIKSATRDQFGVLHVAAHARADTMFPERSAVYLAPGDESEDGWLQPGEIAKLDLRGRLIVLSACDSAEGSLLPGEGPLSLARAFFAGGASSVVATRWPLRDDDAALLMEHFYRALRAGNSAAAALRHARLVGIGDGLPAAAWAGLVVLGDGQHRLEMLPRDQGRASRWLIVAALVAALGGFWRRRRSRIALHERVHVGRWPFS